jgi:DNA-binding NarL/FixJ family response regulator
VPDPLRVVIGEDDVLLREGIIRLLAEGGFEVAAQAGDAEDFLRMELRSRNPDVGILVLSQFYEEEYALDLIGDRGEGVGYLLKERVGDVDAFIDAVTRVARGGSALDPEIVARMLGRRKTGGPLATLSPRELDVLGAMAEGKSNQGIAEALFVSHATVEKHVTSIFHKLRLSPGATEHRRVLAVLTYMQGQPR